MAAKIQKLPWGLFDLLRITQGGEQPDGLSELVIPTVDATDMYGASNLICAFTQTAGVGVRGDVVPSTVPAGEVWRLLGYAIGANTFSTIAGTLRAYGQIVPTGGPGGGFAVATNLQIGKDAAWVPLNVGDTIEVGELFPNPPILIAGTQLRAVLGASYGGTLTLTLKQWYQKLSPPT